MYKPSILFGCSVLVLLTLVAVLAPYLGTLDPARIDPALRNKAPGAEVTILDEARSVRSTAIMGTDTLGRDVYSRTVYGARVSLAVGASVPAIAVAAGLLIGLLSGYVRPLDGVLMRIMDGLMAIPGILLAIALVSIGRNGILTVIIAITVPEVPRVARLVRSLVLSLREELYVEAAISVGTPTLRIMLRHIAPNTVAPLIIQGTFIAASAILSEAILSFLGIGIPPEIPSWGNIMAEGRSLFHVFPHNILFPGFFVALIVLSLNIMGDGLRDTLDPKLCGKL